MLLRLLDCRTIFIYFCCDLVCGDDGKNNYDGNIIIYHQYHHLTE